MNKARIIFTLMAMVILLANAKYSFSDEYLNLPFQDPLKRAVYCKNLLFLESVKMTTGSILGKPSDEVRRRVANYPDYISRYDVFIRAYRAVNSISDDMYNQMKAAPIEASELDINILTMVEFGMGKFATILGFSEEAIGRKYHALKQGRSECEDFAIKIGEIVKQGTRRKIKEEKKLPKIYSLKPTIDSKGQIYVADYGEVPDDFIPKLMDYDAIINMNKMYIVKMKKNTTGSLTGINIKWFQYFDLNYDSLEARQKKIAEEDIMKLHEKHHRLRCYYVHPEAGLYHYIDYWFCRQPLAVAPKRLKARLTYHPLLSIGSARCQCPDTWDEAKEDLPGF